MLTLKKTSAKKKILYVIIFIVLFVVTSYLIYSNFFAKHTTGSTNNINLNVNNELRNAGKDSLGYEDNELDFIQSVKFKNLKDFNYNIVIGEGRNNNPFEY